MKKKFKLGVIGAGFMSTAIINGVLNGKKLNADQIIVSDVNEGALDLMRKVGVTVTCDSCELANQAEFVLFAVKPQNFDDVILKISEVNCKKFISIMAGVKKDKIKSHFSDALVARCMPNTPCAIGCGAVAIDACDFKDESDVQFIKELFSSFANVVFVEEKLLNAVTGVSGSSPAYFYLFLQGIIESGVEKGLSYEDAKILATNTMIGAGNMVKKYADKSLDELIDAVCSKGGTTIEAISIYKKSGLNAITKNAIDACVKRAEELEKL